MYEPSEIPQEAKKIARKFFEHAETVAETRNYDYAAELWSLPSYETYASEGTHPALQQIETIVLGQ